MTNAVIHRAELPLDDRPHGIDLTGEILHTAVRRPGAVDVWYQARPEEIEPMRRSFQVVGTGHPIPAHLGLYIGHKGTAISPDGLLVWHVLESYCQHQDVTETPEWGQLPDTSALCLLCHAHLTRRHDDSPWSPR